MSTRLMGLPFVARRALIAGAFVFLTWISLQLPKNDFSVTLCFASLIGCLWAIGILLPFLKMLFFLFKVALKLHIEY